MMANTETRINHSMHIEPRWSWSRQAERLAVVSAALGQVAYIIAARAHGEALAIALGDLRRTVTEVELLTVQEVARERIQSLDVGDREAK